MLWEGSAFHEGKGEGPQRIEGGSTFDHQHLVLDPTYHSKFFTKGHRSPSDWWGRWSGGGAALARKQKPPTIASGIRPSFPSRIPSHSDGHRRLNLLSSILV